MTFMKGRHGLLAPRYAVFYNYSLKFALMFEYFCDRFFSKKRREGTGRREVCRSCAAGITALRAPGAAGAGLSC